MKIYGLQKMTLLDFPGRIACTVFLSGCDMRCPFCHNSELAEGKAPPLMGVEELLAFLAKRRGMLEGVAVTGGEPLLRGAEMIRLAERIREHRKTHPGDYLKISIGLSDHLLEQVQNDMLDVVFTYLPIKKNSLHCELYKQDQLVLVTRSRNRRYKDGITEAQLLEEKYLMCNFALQDVGQYIRKLFPRFHQFELEIDDCMKIVPYLIGKNNYTFLPKDMADTYIKDKKLREIPLLDFETPVINSYIIYKDSMKDIILQMIQSH